MALKVAVQMDPVETIRAAGDSTVALMLEAGRRGHSLLYYTPSSLTLGAGTAFARAAPIAVRDEPTVWYTLGEARRLDLSAMDVVLLRQDPPFDMAYITSTHILEAIHPATLVVNDPVSVRNAPEKLLVMRFPELMPPTLITRDREEVRAFRAVHGDVILKPLYGNGGAGVFHLKADDANLTALMEIFESAWREPYIAQAYLPAVREGDKRIVIIDGEPMAALNRVPREGEARSNLHVGGRGELSELTDRDREICAAIRPALVERDLIFVGIDVIGGLLTEINITSPTGLRDIVRLGGPDLVPPIWDAIEKRRV
ncbi:MAG TPA: glutathione synthase [Devosiaceae bacterium]|nr:glutathione synthase [Devosiaceae bacterium]